MLSKGYSPERLCQVHVLVGLDIGAESPAEIALSILAEILAIQRGGSRVPLGQKRGETLEKVLAGG